MQLGIFISDCFGQLFSTPSFICPEGFVPSDSFLFHVAKSKIDIRFQVKGKVLSVVEIVRR